MSTTISAAATANASVAYSSSRTDQSQAPTGGFQSALADTAADRDRDKAASADDQDQGKTTTGAASADRGKTAGQKDNAGNNDDGATPEDDNDSAASAKSAAHDDTTSRAGGDVRSAKSVAKALEKLAAALAQSGSPTDSIQDETTTVAASDKTKIPVKGQTKTDEQMLAQVGAEEVVTVAADGSKQVVKTPVKGAADAAGTNDGTDAPASPKDTSTGILDTLSMLGQAAPIQAPVASAQPAPGGDNAAKSGAGDKLKGGLDVKAKLGDLGNAADSTAQTATPATGRSSATDVLHLVSAKDDATSHSHEKLKVADSETLTSSGKMQGVDVLDSRRIIAPVHAQNGANIAATMAGDGEWSSVMRSYSSSDVSTADTMATDKTLNTLTIKMTPESLGTVTASLKLIDGQLSVSLVVENGAAYRKLHEDNGDLIKSLKAHGFSVDQIQISIASPDKSTNDASANNQNQSNHQGQAQQNSNGQNQGNQRQQSQVAFENYGQTSGGLADGATSTGVPGAGNSGSGAGGQLYL